MSIVLATLCLNEMEWLLDLYDQHKDWPGLKRWVFVEAADPVYAATNLSLVTDVGLSVDGTTGFLGKLSREDERVRVIHMSQSKSGVLDQGKCVSRNQYLELADVYEPDFVFVLDADEFYTKADQERIEPLMARTSEETLGFVFGLRSVWRPPSADWPICSREAKGSLFSVPICRGWRWRKGMRHTSNHNTPSDGGGLMSRSMHRFDKLLGSSCPTCFHMGYANRNKEFREAKRLYYEARGEGRTDHRQRYVDCRKAWLDWKEGDRLPHGAEVVEWNGPIPECFR